MKSLKNLWNWIKGNVVFIILLSLLVSFIFAIWGFCELPHEYKTVCECLDYFYDYMRLLFLHHHFEDVVWQLEVARWAALFVFVVGGGHIFINISDFATWSTKNGIKRFKKHYVIFGQDELCTALIRKISNAEEKSIQIVYIVDKEVSKEDYKKYQSKTLKIIEGNPLKGKKDTANVFNDANLIKAAKFFAVCAEDNQNVEIAKNVWEYIGNHPKTIKRIKEKGKLPIYEKKKLSIKESTTALRCYTLVKDNDFKNIVEESKIFKYERKDAEVFYFDGVVFNNVGVQYGVNIMIHQIIPKEWEDNPNILIAGYDDFAIALMLNLSHILTKKHEMLKFHIVTNDETAENSFKKKYWYLFDFAEFEFYLDIDKFYTKEIKLSSIFVCNSNNSKAVNDAVAIRYKLQKNEPCIFILTRNPDYLENVFNVKNSEKRKKILTFENNNIQIFNVLDYFWDLVISHREEIEENAVKLHEQYEITNEIERYEYLSETYKQSNRNAALDFYIKTYVTMNKRFDDKNLELTADFDKILLKLDKHQENYKNEIKPLEVKIKALQQEIKPLKKEITKLKEEFDKNLTLKLDKHQENYDSEIKQVKDKIKALQQKIEPFEEEIRKLQRKIDRELTKLLLPLEDEPHLKTMAMLEHRRWMLEKFYDGWTYGKERNNQYKIHTDLVPWEKLSAKSKNNNFDSIHLLLKTIKDKTNENIQPATA